MNRATHAKRDGFARATSMRMRSRAIRDVDSAGVDTALIVDRGMTTTRGDDARGVEMTDDVDGEDG